MTFETDSDAERVDVDIAEKQGQIDQLRRELAEVCEERDDLQAGFDLRWKADMRAIERWRGDDAVKALRMPDHADLCVWLFEQLEAEREKAERAEARLVVMT